MSIKLENRIRVYRAEHKLSQADLANLIGVSRKTISTIEVGRFVPSTVIALKIAKHFDVQLEDIFWLQETPEEEPTKASASDFLALKELESKSLSNSISEFWMDLLSPSSKHVIDFISRSIG